MGDILKDSRFAKYLNDPRYRQIPKHERKVKIDKRFQSMFNDSKFKVKYTVDKRGRPVNETSTENLRKYYELEESEGSSDSEDEEVEGDTGAESQKDEVTPGRFVKRPQSDDAGPKFQNDKLTRGKLNPKTKERLLDLDVDYARGEGVLLTDSSSDEDSSEEEAESEVEHEWGELDAAAETTEESTKRIAICNMDWDNIKAADIMVLLSSFLPPGGIIYKITIYPSEYGLKRMQEEEVRGPIELTEQREVDSGLSDDGGNEEGSTYHMEKLRRYQLNRLKYYYAVVECDSVATADKLYSECDGMEYESSATRLDMRFIPDDVTFDQEPRETCVQLPDLTKYKPRLFTTTALQQAKVELTWDATAPARAEALRAAGAGLGDQDCLRDYLASNSEDEDEDTPQGEKEANESQSDDEDPIQKYKKLLEEIDRKEESKKNKDLEMEITWGLGVKDKAQELVKKINQDDKKLTPFEILMNKKKEKNKQKRLNKQKAQDKEHSSEAESEDVPSDIDMNDPYFAEEFNKPEFKNKKSKKQEKTETEPTEEDEKQKQELELLLDDDDDKVHFSLKKIQEAESTTKKSKRKKKLKQKMLEQKQALPDFEINLNDQRFSALYNSHHFNIDPTDSNFKKTKNMEKLIQEKLKRRPADNPAEELQPKKSKEDAELSLLVKNIKRKTRDVLKK
ncbi:ESF1 homolog [Cydia amplana]|uniref:ESF1 homolog n=1 Tax=Cydia amplana TaxID=1869771 RepID=UPI002FE68D98